MSGLPESLINLYFTDFKYFMGHLSNDDSFPFRLHADRKALGNIAKIRRGQSIGTAVSVQKG